MASEALVKQTARGPVVVLSLNRSPVNALNAALLTALSGALARAVDDPSVTAIVLASEGAHFSAGSDIGELGRVHGAALPPVVRQIETCPKPVVAALRGNCLGGGLELALACHGRVAQTGARLGLPEIALGLLPVAGATQRLPRLVGAPIAINLLVEGVPVTAVEALAMGLVDNVVDEAPLERATTLAEALATASLVKTADRRDGLRDPMAFQSAVSDARKRIDGWRLPAAAAAVDCVEAALLLPFDMGCGLEMSHAETLAESAEAAGLRHAFLAERRALFPPADISGIAPPKLGKIVVLGTSGLAADVVRQALNAGLHVRLVANNRADLTEALKTVAARQEALVAAAQLSPAAREADWARLAGVLAEEGAGDADLTLATSDAPKLAALPGPVVHLGGKGGVVLHPAPAAGGLCEMSVNPGVPVEQQVAALAFARRLGWKVLFQGPGAPIDQRLRLILSRAIAVLESQGHDRQSIAAALASFGLGAGSRVRLPAAPEGAAQVLEFCMAALMNEGAKLLSEGAARRPLDIDAAAVISGLYPRWEGGPMFGADRLGVMALRAQLRHLSQSAPQIFTPAPILDQLISGGRSFADLNRD